MITCQPAFGGPYANVVCAAPGVLVETPNLTFELPVGWQRRNPSSNMRLAEASIPGPGGAAELAVFHFGAGQGGGVDANLKREDDNLPRIPPGRLGARYDLSAGAMSGDVEYYHTFAQDKVAAYETPTRGYDMLNATLSYRLDLGQTRGVELYVRGTNLLNELAFAHTSFVKDQSPLRGRSLAIGMRHSF